MTVNILDDFSALHNLMQREGLNPIKNGSLQAYIKEQYLIRTLQNAVDEEDVIQIADKSKLAIYSVIDAVEDYAYRLQTDDLFQAVEILDRDGLYDALRFICLEAEYSN